MSEENHEPLEEGLIKNDAISSVDRKAKKRIRQIRLSRMLYAEKMESISKIIVKDLTKNTVLIKAPGFRYVFDRNSKRVFTVSDNREFQAYLNEHYGINREFDFIKKELEREVEYNGQKSEVYQFAFWDKKSGNLFIDKRDGKIIVLDGKVRKDIDNGDKGVFFMSPESAEPIKWEKPDPGACYFSKDGLRLKDADVPDKSHMLKVLTSGLRFTGPLDPHEQKILLLIVIYLLFFESINPTKPILLITGPKGSGKSDLSRNMGQILFGWQYDVVYLRDDERDFIAACVNNYLIALDNVEAKNTKLMDLIAIIATGGTASLRELHTTCNEIRVKPRVFLSMNAIDPKLRRSDIADRLLIFQLERIQGFRGRDAMIDSIKAELPKIWGEILSNLHYIIQQLKKSQSIPAGKFRLQDFEVFAKRICSDPKDVEELLGKMEGLRSEYALDFDNFCLLLDYVFDDEIAAQLGPLTAKELLEKFQKVVAWDKNKENSKNRSIQCFFKNAKSVGRKISKIKPELERVYGLVIHEERSNVVRYEFRHKRDG